MSVENLEITKQILEVIQTTSSETIVLYTAFYAKEAITFMVGGAVLAALGFCAIMYGINENEESPGVMGFIFFVLGVFILMANIAKMLEPEAYAIMRLIEDVRG